MEGWTPVEACAYLPSAAPDTPFDGILVTVDSDATRGFRAGIATTYVLSFAGGNFLSAGAVSPDGRHYAVPNGIINTVTSSDIRYVVQEIRILTTETVPRIVERISWRASFPVGTRFSSNGDIPPILWMDESRIQFVNGTLSDGHTPVEVDVFNGQEMELTRGYPTLGSSPDRSRAVVDLEGGIALIETSTGSRIADLPAMPLGVLQIAWSPNGQILAMTALRGDAVALQLYDADGVLSETVLTLPAEQILWNLRWSPDGSRLAFTAFDPQSIENRLHIADVQAQTVTDTCLPLVADVNGKPLGTLAWSPDSTRVAVIIRQGSSRPQVQIFDVAERTRYTLIPAAGRLLGWYP